MVGILIFVHQHIAEFSLVIMADGLILLEQLNRNVDNVVKIQGVVILQLGLITFICPGNILGANVTGVFGSPKHFLRGNHLVLLPADGSKDILWRKGLFVHVQILQNSLHHPFRIRGIINREAAGVSHGFNIPPKDAAAGGVKGHCPNILSGRPQQGSQPILDFVGGFVGEGNGDDAPGNRRFHSAQTFRPPEFILRGAFCYSFQKRYILIRQVSGDFATVAPPAKAHEVCDTVDEYGGFSAPCTGQQKQRPFRCQNGLLLHFIELRKLGCDIVPPGVQESFFHLFCHSCTCLSIR